MPNSTLAQMGFLDEDTQQEAVYDLEDTQARTDIGTINGKIPSNASSSNKMATASDITDINNKIPSNASSSNKLATISDVSAAYKPKGNATLATLPSLTADHLNWVYNMTEDFVTTSDFAEGAGKSVEAGNEVGIIDVSTTSTPSYKYTVLGGFVDTSSLQPKTLETPVEVGGVNRTTVQAALGALANDKEDTILAATPLVKEYDEVMHQEVLRLTQDDAPINNSNNPVKSGGIYTALADKASKDNVIANTKLIKDTVGWSGKNKFKIRDDFTGETKNGVVFTIDSKRIITANNQATAVATIDLGKVTLPAGKYIASGCPSGGDSNSYRVNVSKWVNNQEQGIGFDYGDGLEFTLAEETVVYMYPRIASGYTASNLKFKLMMRPADILDPTYEPYFGSTAFPRSEQAVLGAKNLLKNSAITKTENGITATVNSNGTITLNGTSTGEFTMRIGPVSVMSGKTYTISSGGDNDSTTTQRLWSESSNAFPVGNRLATDGNVNKTRTALANETFNVKLQIFAGQTYNNVIVYPMISFDGGTYVPYAMTNRELTDEVTPITGTITSDFTIGDNTKLRRQGNLVSLTLFLNAVTKDANQTIATLPSGFGAEKTTPLVGWNTTDSTPVYLYIENGVSIKTGASLSSKNIRLTAVWANK